jgi:hypothetical protein
VVALAGTTPVTTLPVSTSPSVRGLALVRVFVNEESRVPAIDDARRAAICAPLLPGASVNR